MYLQLLLSPRTAMWSMPVDLTEWENDNYSQNQWESLRITINTVIFIHLCHLALDHWRGKTLFYVILSDLWISLKLILDDSRWFMNQSEIDSWWFLVILDDLQISLKLILNDLWTTLKSFLGQFLVILGDSGWFSVICESVWNWFLVILSNSQWFTNQSEIDSWWFLAILGDSWTTLKSFLGRFSVICKSVWNCLGVILSDSLMSFYKMTPWHHDTANFSKYFLYFLVFAPAASILNRFLQTR